MSEKEKKSRYNEKVNKRTQQYIKENYKQLSIRLPKEGEITREKIASAADMAGMSVNAYIIEAVKEKMDQQGIVAD